MRGEVVGVDGAFADRDAQGRAGGGEVRGLVGARVGDVDGAVIRGEGDAVGLGEGVFHDMQGAGGGGEAVGGCAELRWGVGQPH